MPFLILHNIITPLGIYLSIFPPYYNRPSFHRPTALEFQTPDFPGDRIPLGSKKSFNPYVTLRNAPPLNAKWPATKSI